MKLGSQSNIRGHRTEMKSEGSHNWKQVWNTTGNGTDAYYVLLVI